MKKISFEILKKKKYGKLKIIEEADVRNGRRMFVCKCDCGDYKTIPLYSLRCGDSKSCGCLQKEVTIKRSTKHGFTPAGKPQPLEYRIWASMIQRCENPNDRSYKYYGGRGIKVCKRWHNFKFFIQDMGKKPTKNHSIDRIDNNGDYKKSNCRWATKKQQSNNRRNNKK